jgi:predicted transcriptional regulator
MRTMGELEAVIMQILWSADEPTTVREVLGKIDRQPPLAYTTVLTVMDNLHRKGVVRRERAGRAHAYWPTKARADYTADLMDSATPWRHRRPAPGRCRQQPGRPGLRDLPFSPGRA